jgi:peptide/nickel transport system permease protein
VVVVPLHLLVFAVATFFLVRSVPGDPVIARLGQNWTMADYKRTQAALGLDGSLLDQFLRYMGNLLTLNLGNSLTTGRPVIGELAVRLPATLELALQSMALTILVSLICSYFAVMRPANVISGALRAHARAAGAIPEYVLAVIALFVFYSVLRWVPAPLGRLSPIMSPPARVSGFPMLDAIVQGQWEAAGSIFDHTILPIAVMTFAQSALLLKLLMVSLEEALDSAPTRFRIAAGATRLSVILSIYRRALPPAVIMSASLFGYMVGGAVIIETLFGFSGLGKYSVESVSTANYPALQGVLLVIATTSLLLFLLIDIVNMLMDPRRRPGVRTEES